MTSDNFDRAFEYLLLNEGGYSNHAADPGGATKYGITLATLARWRAVNVTAADVQALTRDQAKTIYREFYWDALALDRVEKLVVQTVLFDAAVLFGPRLAVIRAQKVAASVDRGLLFDGVLGPKTINAVNSMEQSLFVIGFQTELRARINDVIRCSPKSEVFRKGWENRVDRFTTLIA